MSLGAMLCVQSRPASILTFRADNPSVITPDIQGSSIISSFFQSIRVTVMINEAGYFEYFGSEIM